MGIQMIGIDHKECSLLQRERFALSDEDIENLYQLIIKEIEVEGILLLSTCNRTEFWTSSTNDICSDLIHLVCRYKGDPEGEYSSMFCVRKEDDAITHLFRLLGGLESRIIGDEQILTQVKNAVVVSREHKILGKTLGVLFESAIHAGKRVRTEVSIPKNRGSLIKEALTMLKDKNISINGTKCLVIGNGVMGKEISQIMYENGADVTIAVREHSGKPVERSKEFQYVEYSKRYESMNQYNIIISVTTSPNYTIEKKYIENCFDHLVVLMDFAVPRDIESEIGELENVKLYNIDDFRTTEWVQEIQEYQDAVIDLLAKYEQEFMEWYLYRDIYDNIDRLTDSISENLKIRLCKPLKKVNQENRELLDEAITKATNKTLKKMFFILKNQVNITTFRECILGLEKGYENEN